MVLAAVLGLQAAKSVDVDDNCGSWSVLHMYSTVDTVTCSDSYMYSHIHTMLEPTDTARCKRVG
jgi:hypothetical protein